MCCVWMCQEQRKESEARTKTEKRQLWFWWVWDEEAIAKVRSKNRNQSKAKSKAEWMELVGGLMMGERRYAHVAPWFLCRVTQIDQKNAESLGAQRFPRITSLHTFFAKNTLKALCTNAFGVCTFLGNVIFRAPFKIIRFLFLK